MGSTAGSIGSGAVGGAGAGAIFGPVGVAVGALAGAGLGAFGAYEQGAGTQAADNAQAAELRLKAKYAGAAAAETNATLTDRLATTLGNIDAVRAAAHTDPSSPTTLALRNRATSVGNQETAIRVGNILAQQSTDLASANYLTSAGNFALSMGDLTAGADVAGAIGKTNPNLFGLPGSSPAQVPDASVSGGAVY